MMKKIIKDALTNKRSWEELEKSIASIESTKDKGDAFEYVAAYYFKYFDRKFEVKNVYMRHEMPEEVIRRIKLENIDYGVDGVIERRDGKLTAYQVKFRTEQDMPSFRELSTFWTEAEYADFRLVFANSKTLPKPATKRKNHLAVLVDDLMELDESEELPKGCFFDYMTSMILGETLTPTQYAVPRPYQQEMIDKVAAEFKTSDRTKAIAACGVGKTLLAKFIHDIVQSKITLFMAPSLALIKQALEEWSTKTEHEFLFLAVCSDSSVVSDNDEIRMAAHEVNFPVTTDPNDIGEFIDKETPLPKVIFSTYHSVDAVMVASLKHEIEFDLGIFDEAHKTAGNKQSKQFTLAMENEFIAIKKRLFMTATERVVTKKIQDAAVESGCTVYSMDDVEKYGKVSANLNFGKAIQQDIIADYKIVVASIKEQEAQNWMKANKIVATGDSDVTMEYLFKKLLIVKAMKELGITKVLSYHSSVSRAKEFTGETSELSLRKIFNSVIGDSPDLDVTFGHVNGAMSSASRKSVLDKLSSADLGVVSNARCLTEGVNVPVVDAVYFADQKSSLIDIVQAIGRAVRKPSDEPKTAYIILPVVISDDVSTFSGINATKFEAIHDAIQALREADEDLAERIDEVNYSIVTGGSSGHSGALDGKIMHLPFGELAIDSFESSLQLRVGEVNTRDSNDVPLVTYSSEKGSRKSNFKRKLTTVGDYNIDAYLDMVIPTVENFIGREADVLTKKDLELIKNGKVNHNNVSHTERIGAIQQVGRGKYILTSIGRAFIDESSDKKKLFINQMLRYSTVNKSSDDVDDKFIFPYRAILTIAQHFEYIRKLDFLYCIYALANTSEKKVQEAIANMKHLQESFPNLESLSDTNKKKVLEILNKEMLDDDYEFSLLDVWSSRGTTYNQFNYFKKHLMLFDNAFTDGELKDRIYLKKGHKTAIHELLSMSSDTYDLAITGPTEDSVKALYSSPL
jgi:superfamily II DNA or RNA helicase